MTIEQVYKICGDLHEKSLIRVFGAFGTVILFEGLLSEFIEKHHGLYSLHNIVNFNIIDPETGSAEFNIW